VTSVVLVPAGWRTAFRRHERTIATCWIIAVVLGLGALAVTPIRVRLLNGLQAVVDHWDDRWSRRLAYGESLYRSGDYAAAAAYLERLDAEFPARTVRHGRDKQREWLLTLLGRSYVAMAKKGKAMKTFARLVAFDSLNYRNHYEQAQAAEKLLSGWALAPEARDAYAQVLVLAPYHLPSVRGVIAYSSEKGEPLPVIAAYEKYLDAFFIQRVQVRLGDSSFTITVPVDGYAHDIPLPLAAPKGWSGKLTLRPGGFAIALDSVVLTPAVTVGVAQRRSEVTVPVTPLIMEGVAPGPQGAVVPQGYESTLSVTIPPQPAGIEQVRLRLRLFKPVDGKMWETVQVAYHNLLDAAGRDRATARTVPFASDVAADSVLLRQPWAREGEEFIVDDRGN